MKDGTKTTEFWLTALTGLFVATMALLVAYGVITSEQADVWLNLLMVLAAIVTPIIVGWLAKSYGDDRTELKVAQLEALGER